jgi:hypothetical protein
MEKSNTKYFAVKGKLLREGQMKTEAFGKNELIPFLEIEKPHFGRNPMLREDQNYTHCYSTEKLNMGDPEPLTLLGYGIILLEEKAKSWL